MKYALIGCGRIATNHMKAVLNNQLELIAVCDLLPQAMEELLKKHGLDIPGTVYFDEGLDHLSSFYLAKPDERHYEILLDKNGKLVGGIGLAEFPFAEGCAELQKLYLADSVKGNGIGYYLIRLIEEKASALGYTKVYVETHSNLQAAIHIYTKAGYQRMDRPDFVQHGTMDTFFLKDLADNRH